MRLLALLLMACLTGCDADAGRSPGDVPTYRGDSARTGVMPGPGPISRPSLAWTFQAGGPIRSSPAVAGGSVFVASTDGVVHALALEGGTRRWSAAVATELGAATPLLLDGLVVVADRVGAVHALKAESGERAWQVPIDGPVAGAAVAAGGAIVVATQSGSAYAFDPSTGAVRWRAELPAPVEHSIAATDELVYASVSGGTLVALRTDDGTVAWATPVVAAGGGGTPTIAEGLVFAPAGLEHGDPVTPALVVLDAATGIERWRRTSPISEELYAPAVRDGVAWIVGEDETVAAVDVATGADRWTTTTGAPNDALPAVWDATVYVATTGGELQALDAESGQLGWQVDIVGIPYAPVVTRGMVLVGTNLGVLHAFGEPTP